VVEGVDGIQLDPPRLDQWTDRLHHPVVLVVPRPTGLGGEGDDGAAEMAVPDHGARMVQTLRGDLRLFPVHGFLPAVRFRYRKPTTPGWASERYICRMMRPPTKSGRVRTCIRTTRSASLPRVSGARASHQRGLAGS